MPAAGTLPPLTTAPAQDAPTTLADARRITEADPDFARLHAQTVRRLTASLRAYVRALRTAPASAHPDLATAFVHRQVGILRASYAQAHKEGVRDYYGAFSRTPGRWLHTPLAPQQPAPHIMVRRLGFYAPSVAKMAHEALQALTREKAAAAAATAPAKLAENIPISILLAGDPPANTGDFLDGISQRVNLQAEITWSGFNDGYVDAGGSDPANPYNLIAWVMNPPSKHCGECPVYEANSPYDPPWVQGGNQLNATPGDGHTECGAGCKCSLEYVSAAAAGAAGGPDPRGTIWDSPNGPTPPPGPDGQPGKWPNIAGVADMSTLAPEQQQALQDALDAYRRAFERWESIRGTLPSLPDMFGVAGGEGAITGGVWPEWESLSPSQQKALGEVYQALSDFNAASGAPTMEEVQAGLAASQQQMEDILAQSQDMRDQLADMVAAAQAEQQQTQQELFGGGPLKQLLRQLLMGLDDWIDLQKDTWYQLFHGGDGGGNGGGDQQFADAAADADAIRLFNPYHDWRGRFTGPGGSGIGGGDEEMVRISRGGGTGEHPLVHARAAGGGGGGGGGHQREAITPSGHEDHAEMLRMKALLDSHSADEQSHETTRRIAKDLAQRLRGNADFDALAAQLVGYEHGDAQERAAMLLMHGWGGSSQHPLSLALNDAAAKEFGISESSHHVSIISPLHQAVVPLEDHEAGLRAFTRAVYDNTQAWFASRGITSVALSRGMGWNSGREPSGVNWHRTGKEMPMHLKAISSFSVDPTIASDVFASYQPYRMVIHGRVPVSRIFSTCQTGPGTKYESEMLVLGGGSDTFTVDTSTGGFQE